MRKDNRSYNRAIDDLYQLSKKYEFVDPSQNTKSNWTKLKKNADRALLNKASRVKCSKILDQKSLQQTSNSDLLQELTIVRSCSMNDAKI